MADIDLEADSAQVTHTDTDPQMSPADAGSETSPKFQPIDRDSEAFNGLSVTFRRIVADYHYAREMLTSSPDDISHDEDERASLAYNAASAALIKTPAENLHDLRAKFDSIWADPAADPSNDTILSFFADFRRLTGGTVSVMFNPSVWLHYFERREGAYCVRGEEVFLLQPNGSTAEDNMFELEALGGKSAVDDLILRRTAEVPSDAVN